MPQPHRHEPNDARPRTGRRARRDDARVLCAPRLGRPHHHRGRGGRVIPVCRVSGLRSRARDGVGSPTRCIGPAGVPGPPASTASNCTEPTVTSSTPSWATAATPAPTSTAARSSTAPGSRSKRSTRRPRSGGGPRRIAIIAAAHAGPAWRLRSAGHLFLRAAGTARAVWRSYWSASPWKGRHAVGAQLRRAFAGAYIANEDFTPLAGDAILVQGEADAVAFGQLMLANPDLPARIAAGAPLNVADKATFFSAGTEGYDDHPPLG